MLIFGILSYLFLSCSSILIEDFEEAAFDLIFEWIDWARFILQYFVDLLCYGCLAVYHYTNYNIYMPSSLLRLRVFIKIRKAAFDLISRFDIPRKAALI